MDLFKLLAVSELIGDDYNPKCWHLRGFKYTMMWLGCLAAQVLSLVLGYYLQNVLICIVLYVGTAVVSFVLLYCNDDNDTSWFLMVVLTGLIVFTLGVTGVLND